MADILANLGVSRRRGANVRICIGLSDSPEGATCSDVVKADCRLKFSAVGPRLAKRRMYGRRLTSQNGLIASGASAQRADALVITPEPWAGVLTAISFPGDLGDPGKAPHLAEVGILWTSPLVRWSRSADPKWRGFADSINSALEKYPACGKSSGALAKSLVEDNETPAAQDITRLIVDTHEQVLTAQACCDVPCNLVPTKRPRRALCKNRRGRKESSYAR